MSSPGIMLFGTCIVAIKLDWLSNKADTGIENGFSKNYFMSNTAS